MRLRLDFYLRGKLEVAVRGRCLERPSMDHKEAALAHHSSDAMAEVQEAEHIPHLKRTAADYMEVAPETQHGEYIAMDC
jgi:hypothetical protein